MFMEISPQSKDKTINQNIFTFDEDDQEPEQSIQVLTSRVKNKVDRLQKCQQTQKDSRNQQNPKVPQVSDLFTFEEDDEDEILPNEEALKQNHSFDTKKQCKTEMQKISQNQDAQEEFNYLKNRILFKENNNFFNKNIQIHKSSSSFENVPESPEPQVITKNFQKKVKKLRESFKENDLKDQILTKKISQSSLQKSKPFQKNSERSVKKLMKLKNILSQQNNFDAFKESKANEQKKSKFHIQGAKIVKNEDQTKQEFEYVEEKKAIKVTNLREFLFTQLSEEYKVNALITRVQDGGFLGKLVNKTKYVVTIEQNNKFIFSVVKEGFNKFIFSMNKENCTQKNKSYLGQLVSKDFSNTEFMLYDNGFDPKETKCLEYSFKQLASIKYEEGSGPKKFSVIMSTNNLGFYTIESEVNVLEKKWAQKKERKNLCKLYSKEPQFDETDGNYKLDLKGMMGKASVKNFVLSSDDYEDCLKFVRRNSDTYALEIRHPFSLVQAIAVCISSIYHKSIL